ncbi:MAG TPA: tetratricopeptide repeat protein [Polyangiaceae bacterium]|jgi:tetratricopeptide (TPR) repeat protein
MSARVLVLGAMLAVFFAATPALAQTRSDHEVAVALFTQSDEAYKKGDFRGAADDLEKAYALEPAPVLLYNLGRAYEGLGDQKKAIDAYERYLSAQPDAEDRGAIEQRVATMKKQLEMAQRASAPVVVVQAPVVSPPPARRRAMSPVPIVIGAIGLAGIAGGGVLGALALGESSTENAATTSQLDAASAHDRAATFATGANVAFIAGAVLAAVGIVWIIVDRATAPSARAASLPLGVTF